jgi:sulfur-oxidizing protein SoxZ
MGTNVGDARIRVPDRIGRGEVITVNSIISHPMDTGFFRTKEGDPIPAYFITEVVVTYAGEPVVSFSLRADREGPLTMTWKDNKGAVYSQSVDIAFAAA